MSVLKIDLKTIPYLYNNDENSIICANFTDKTKIEIYISISTVFAFFYDENGNQINKKSKVQYYPFDSIAILPQITPIRENEKILTRETIEQDKDTYLSSRHFRNELYLYKDKYFNDFKDFAEKSWPGLNIESLYIAEDKVEMYIIDGRCASEVGLTGSGIQMWLQVIWLISRSRGSSTIILDEPDVYLHPDLQRKILLIAKKNFQQVIIATHSVAMLSG